MTTQYALVLDNSYHAVVLRDLFQKKAQEHHDRWASASSRHAMQRNAQLYEMYRDLADRCEQIRLDVIAEIKKGGQ